MTHAHRWSANHCACLTTLLVDLDARGVRGGIGG